MVIDDPSKWQGPRIKLKVGSKAMFKFLHPEWPILASVTLSDWQDNQLVQETDTVTYFLNSSTPKDHLKTELDSGVGAAQSCLMISFIGCPTILDPLCFLLFCQLLLYQNTKVG